ncbi:LLM class flavin-dependent oxidoreductase [Variovorax fucosicus]|uniref:LLM class flavin-dependent oxidoreductase n=1 Tax=Variovorax fucosicus TaxID=3053517 RepID=UPI00257785D4|nr:LLM class flavin-dependent oxidoreductase [Variovorax sp. J22G47]MDM0059062.1 LLM class flavin-dependent oxidoreductase [Variovorax sp. J22G47]
MNAAASRELLLNAFEMNTVGHLAHGLWRHPRDQSRRHNDIAYWQQLARTLEAGLFDGLFLADVTGVYDVYGGSEDAALRHAIQLPVHDPVPLIPAMAAVTKHLGFGVTVNLSHEQPHLFARRMSTLDHLSGGRLGWNIVTGFLESAARAAGAPRQAGHDDRYARGEDFMDAVYQLWEASWDDDAVRADVARGVYADPARVRRIRHEGPWYRVDALHLTEPSPQRTPVLYQAGASARGIDFAVRHAECIFLPNQGLAATAALVARLRAQLAAAGRAPQSVRILTSIEVIVAPTDVEAHEKVEDYARYAQPEAALAQFAAATGIDFSRYGPDEPIRAGRGEGIRSAHDAVAAGNDGEAWTVRRLLDGMRLGARFTPIVGSPARVADELLRWADTAGVDGFNLVRTVAPECFEDFARLVVPELQARGRFKRHYTEGTLREKLFGTGQACLPATHVGAAWRPSSAPSA